MRGAWAFVLLACAPVAMAEPLVVPFDFSRSAIGLEVTIGGTPVYALLDTGVDPSAIDLAHAAMPGVTVDRGDSGEATGFGEGKDARIYAAKISGLAFGGRSFAPFDAVASDLRGASQGYGRKLDAILGLSFLADKTLLIDYPGHRLAILSATDDPGPLVRGCARQWSAPLRMVEGFPVIPEFRFGEARAPVTLDTGSNGGIALYQSALAVPGLHDKLVPDGTVHHSGARGDAVSPAFRFTAPVGLGPFTLPPGQAMILHGEQGSLADRVANVGNQPLAQMRLKVLLDYPGKRMVFYGQCS